MASHWGRVRTKICGITRLDDARFAQVAGVDALGFIFYPKSPRVIPREKAREILASLPPYLIKTGVFVNASPAEVQDRVALGLNAVQLHGKEDPAYCLKLKKELPHCILIKAFRVAADHLPDLEAYDQAVDMYLFDTYVKDQPGGTGLSFDWQLAHGLQPKKPWLLAGGLSPDNLVAAVKAAAPGFVDLNSGVEKSPGVKDHEKIRAALRLVRGCWQLSGDDETAVVAAG